QAICTALAAEGAIIAVHYHKQEAAALDLVGELGGAATAFQADITAADQAQSLVDRVVERMGGIDILINNAGIINDGLLVRMSDSAWDDVMGTNLNGTFHCTRAVLRQMIRQRWGRIINIGSVVGIRGNIGQVNYTASKAAIIGFTKALAKEVATRNITVNTVTPGYISTDTVDVLPQETKDRIMTWIPQGHFGEVDDVAHLVAYLSSERAKYMTGQIVSVDGGMAS
ncbi:MAG: 3-oxoacyl-ACP reductase FabG, partial [SAR202 cluster bacterium]|nr:3-oxoacyl-ACP reductase FabG [SAR202 cluster bacterium]